MKYFLSTRWKHTKNWWWNFYQRTTARINAHFSSEMRTSSRRTIGTLLQTAYSIVLSLIRLNEWKNSKLLSIFYVRLMLCRMKKKLLWRVRVAERTFSTSFSRQGFKHVLEIDSILVNFQALQGYKDSFLNQGCTFKPWLTLLRWYIARL